VFARGKVSASFDEVELARGHSSAQMASNRLLAPLAEKPLVHRDELVVFD
jgi:glutamate 5-kinase